MKATKARGGSAVSLMILSLSLAACSRGLDQFQHRQRAQAPTNARDVGVVVEGASEAEMVQLLTAHPEARFRDLSRPHGLYEVFGVQLKDIVRDLPDHSISSNQFFKLERQGPSPMEALQKKAASGDQLQKCQENPVKPTSELDIVAPKKMLGENLVLVGTTLTFASAKSSAHPDHPSKLKKAWVIMPPEGSKESERMVLGDTLTLNTQDLGVYAVGLVVQDDQAACGLAMVQIAVTANRPYLGPSPKGDNSLAKIGLAPFTHLGELHAREAWDVSQGSGILIAIIDSGVNYNHIALRDNIAVNQREIPGNGKDDDGNGFIDDVTGYDFSNGDAFPYDDEGHGSHVSGLAASPLFGMAKGARILPVKALGASGGDAASVAAGILYAVDRGAKVLNLSLGTYGAPAPALVRALDYAESKNVLVVAAAGNGHPATGVGLNTDKTPNFPSALPNDNIVAVAAKGTNVLLAPYSNFGANTVDVIAPGGSSETDVITSAYKENTSNAILIGEAGTSMATPIVSGIAADVWAQNPTLTAVEVKAILMKSGTLVPELKKVIQSGRNIDALDAVRLAQSRSL